MRLLADHVVAEPWDTAELGAIDTLLVAGSPKAADARPGTVVTDWLAETAGPGPAVRLGVQRRFPAGRGGPAGRSAVTTHWAVADRLAQGLPAAMVEADASHVRDGRLRTAAGVTAGLDLALALVEEDLGREIALAVAAQLVMFFKRPGGQMQFSRDGEAAPAGRSILQSVQRWVVANPAEDHGVARLAQPRRPQPPALRPRCSATRSASPPPPGPRSVRIEAARRLLEAGEAPPKQVRRAAAGSPTPDTLRRAFVRRVGVTPADYRNAPLRRDPRLESKLRETAMKDRLFLLRPDWIDQDRPWFCMARAAAEGFLGYYPAVRGALDVAYLPHARPRHPVVDLLGEANQNKADA